MTLLCVPVSCLLTLVRVVSLRTTGNSYEELPGLKEQEGAANDADADIHIEEDIT